MKQQMEIKGVAKQINVPSRPPSRNLPHLQNTQNFRQAKSKSPHVAHRPENIKHILETYNKSKVNKKAKLDK